MDIADLYRFSGRVGRLQFALTQIGVFTAAYVFLFLVIVLTGAGDESRSGITDLGQTGVVAVSAMVAFNLGWISLAAAVRRCHDRGLSGWMLLFVMPPLLGQLWMVLSLVTGEGQKGRNRHGSRRSAFAPKPVELSEAALLA